MPRRRWPHRANLRKTYRECSVATESPKNTGGGKREIANSISLPHGIAFSPHIRRVDAMVTVAELANSLQLTCELRDDALAASINSFFGLTRAFEGDAKQVFEFGGFVSVPVPV